MKLVALASSFFATAVFGFGNGDGTRYSLKNPDFTYWNDTNDDILTEFKTLMTIAEHRSKMQGEYGSTLRTLQRFAELVDMIMYMQRVPFFGQYWYYGCWCAPEGFLKTVGSGYGKPVDAIDRSCRDMSECYECTQMDFGEDCTTAEVNYRWHGELDEDGNKVIFCDDPEDTCAWAICNCDKKLAEDLRGNERVWNLHHHQKWGDFNRDDACFPTRDRFDGTKDAVIGAKSLNSAGNAPAGQGAPGAGGIGGIGGAGGADGAPMEWDGNWARSFNGETVQGELLSEMPDGPSLKLKLAGEFGNKNVKACCGKYPLRYPYRLGHNHACCVNETPYNILYSECCVDGTVAKSGSCLV
jgi:hypothetical protein